MDCWECTDQTQSICRCSDLRWPRCTGTRYLRNLVEEGLDNPGIKNIIFSLYCYSFSSCSKKFYFLFKPIMLTNSIPSKTGATNQSRDREKWRQNDSDWPLNILNTSDRKLTTNWLNLISLQAYILMKTSR